MKHLILAFLICFSSLAGAEKLILEGGFVSNPEHLVVVGTISGWPYAVHTTTVRRIENVVNLDIVTNNPDNNTLGLKSYYGTVFGLSIDCSGHAFAFTRLSFFDSKGKLLWDDKTDDPFYRPIHSGTLAQQVFLSVCNNR